MWPTFYELRLSDTEFYTLDFQIFKEKGSSDTRILYATSFTWPPTLSSKVDRCWRPRRLCEPAQEGRGFHLFSVASVMHSCAPGIIGQLLVISIPRVEQSRILLISKFQYYFNSIHDGNLLLEFNFDTIFESELLTEVYLGQHNCLFNYMII